MSEEDKATRLRKCNFDWALAKVEDKVGADLRYAADWFLGLRNFSDDKFKAEYPEQH